MPYRRTQRYQAHVWMDKKQVYLGAYDDKLQVRGRPTTAGSRSLHPRVLQSVAVSSLAVLQHDTYSARNPSCMAWNIFYIALHNCICWCAGRPGA